MVDDAQERRSADEDQLTTQISQTTFQISFSSNTAGRDMIEPGTDDQSGGSFLIDDMSTFFIGSVPDAVQRTCRSGAIVDWMLGTLILRPERGRRTIGDTKWDWRRSANGGKVRLRKSELLGRCQNAKDSQGEMKEGSTQRLREENFHQNTPLSRCKRKTAGTSIRYVTFCAVPESACFGPAPHLLLDFAVLHSLLLMLGRRTFLENGIPEISS